MVIGTLLTVWLWLRNAVRGVPHQALTDGLTGVPNRRGWDQALMRAVDRGRRVDAVAMLDLDHFKVFNDEHGYQTGDLLLQTAVRGWRSGLRSSDTIARYGGEEFAILLDGCALASAGKLIDDLRRLVPRGLTCSAGIAKWDRRETPEALMLREGRVGMVNALEGARDLPRNSTLFINISVAALLDPEHDRPDAVPVRLTGRKPHQVVLEISERESITDLPRFAAAVRAYREKGFLFAVGLVSSGPSTLAAHHHSNGRPSQSSRSGYVGFAARSLTRSMNASTSR